MSIPVDRDAIRRLMEAANRVAPHPDAMGFYTEADRRKYTKMSKAQRQARWDKGRKLSPQHRAVLDGFREGLLDAMPNLTPRKK